MWKSTDKGGSRGIKNKSRQNSQPKEGAGNASEETRMVPVQNSIFPSGFTAYKVGSLDIYKKQRHNSEPRGGADSASEKTKAVAVQNSVFPSGLTAYKAGSPGILKKSRNNSKSRARPSAGAREKTTTIPVPKTVFPCGLTKTRDELSKGISKDSISIPMQEFCNRTPGKFSKGLLKMDSNIHNTVDKQDIAIEVSKQPMELLNLVAEICKEDVQCAVFNTVGTVVKPTKDSKMLIPKELLLPKDELPVVDVVGRLLPKDDLLEIEVGAVRPFLQPGRFLLPKDELPEVGAVGPFLRPSRLLLRKDELPVVDTVGRLLPKDELPEIGAVGPLLQPGRLLLPKDELSVVDSVGRLLPKDELPEVGAVGLILQPHGLLLPKDKLKNQATNSNTKSSCFCCKFAQDPKIMTPLDNLPSEKPIAAVPLKKPLRDFDYFESCSKQFFVHRKKRNLEKIAMDDIRNKRYTNVIVRIDTEVFHCHLHALQCYTNYFHNVHHMAEVSLPSKEVTALAFRIIYDWMITEKAQFGPDYILEVLRGAIYLKIPNMLQQIWYCLEFNEYYTECLAFKLSLDAQPYQDLHFLEDLMLSRVRRCFLMLSSTIEFAQMPFRSFRSLMTSNYIAVNTEIEVFYSAILWLHYKWPERESLIPEAMDCVRFELIPIQNLDKLLNPTAYDLVNHITSRHDVQKLIKDAIFNNEIIQAIEMNPELINTFKHMKLRKPIPRLFICSTKLSYHQITPKQLYNTIDFNQFLQYSSKMDEMSFEYWNALEVK